MSIVNIDEHIIVVEKFTPQTYESTDWVTQTYESTIWSDTSEYSTSWDESIIPTRNG